MITVLESRRASRSAAAARRIHCSVVITTLGQPFRGTATPATGRILLSPKYRQLHHVSWDFVLHEISRSQYLLSLPTCVQGHRLVDITVPISNTRCKNVVGYYLAKLSLIFLSRAGDWYRTIWYCRSALSPYRWHVDPLPTVLCFCGYPIIPRCVSESRRLGFPRPHCWRHMPCWLPGWMGPCSAPRGAQTSVDIVQRQRASDCAP